MPGTAARGRPRLYCRQACRQRAYETRRRQQEGTLRAGEVPVSEKAYRQLLDRLYSLTAALEDVDQDLAGSPALREYKAAFLHLYAVASALRGFELEPSN